MPAECRTRSVHRLMQMLPWLGRQGTRAVAALVVLGVALPGIGAVLKPFVTQAVFVLLCVAFLRVDVKALHGHLGRPALVLVATAWTSVAIPILFGALCLAVGLNRSSPDLFIGLMLQGIASPMMAAPALAALLELDATLVLVALITSTALVPVTAPAFVYSFVGSGLTLSPVALGARLLTILAGSAVVGGSLRALVGVRAIERHKEAIDGFNILVLFVFVAAVTEDVAARTLAAPVYTLGMAGLAFGVFFALFYVTLLLFRPAGRGRALAIAFMVSQRNLGLMLAATGGAVPALTWLYVALAQFPIYLSPHLLRRMARRAHRPTSS